MLVSDSRPPERYEFWVTNLDASYQNHDGRADNIGMESRVMDSSIIWVCVYIWNFA